MKKYIASIILLFFTACSALYAQQVVSGRVINKETKEGIPAVSVTLSGSREGAYTNDKGYFRFSTAKPYPFTIYVSTIGYVGKEVSVTGASQVILFELEASSMMGQEVVVSASRYTQKNWNRRLPLKGLEQKTLLIHPSQIISI
jgi:hypothetical protein